MNFENIIKAEDTKYYDSMSEERHIPYMEVLKNYDNSGKDYIHIVVGENVKHPNSLQHQIQWIELYARTQMLDTIKIGGSTSPRELHLMHYSD
ncbi:desulfoferrodoxin family protein [Methanohalophilus mahii]|uniref:Desulfoferrodoxin ferrous iron-binding domain-containing protein n=1 Tax=Methanohalophilus mahii (strain ATCC 35705 / DSM 5219 / SLP) TaxID=547558 RepID=D5EAB0_METMS|nr:desulfoferrodoxin family protein [Methanohalophilus mahii]ADE36111.1 hypothetical protein Mmah_0585 [Methanohalophilus mahii DSM 5219]